MEVAFYQDGGTKIRSIIMVYEGGSWSVYDRAFLEGKWVGIYVEVCRLQHLAQTVWAGRVALALASNGFYDNC